jgi:hypothetical protein
MASKKTGDLEKLSKTDLATLIEYCHGHSAIWDVRTTDYRNRDVKAAAWTSICVVFSTSQGIECTGLFHFQTLSFAFNVSLFVFASFSL